MANTTPKKPAKLRVAQPDNGYKTPAKSKVRHKTTGRLVNDRENITAEELAGRILNDVCIGRTEPEAIKHHMENSPEFLETLSSFEDSKQKRKKAKVNSKYQDSLALSVESATNPDINVYGSKRVRFEASTESARRTRVGAYGIAERASKRVLKDYKIEISPQDLTRLFHLFGEEISDCLLHGYEVAIPPIGIIKPYSFFTTVYSPLYDFYIPNWFRPALTFKTTKRFFNALRIYELSRRSNADKERFKSALTTQAIDEAQALYKSTVSDDSVIDFLEEELGFVLADEDDMDEE